LSADEITELSKLSSVDDMFAWRSPSSKPYRELRGKATDDELIEMMVDQPRLIRRPILTDGSQIVLGFKQGAYDELI
jgi:regulatory protein spx